MNTQGWAKTVVYLALTGAAALVQPAAAAVSASNLLVKLNVVESCAAVSGASVVLARQPTQFTVHLEHDAKFDVRCNTDLDYAVALDWETHAHSVLWRMNPVDVLDTHPGTLIISVMY